MGDLYKQVGGWKGIRKDILEPLAEYQKSKGMDTSFTRLYDAYKKVDPIWRKLHEEKEPPQKEQPRVGMGDLRVSEAAANGLFGDKGQNSSMDAGIGQSLLAGKMGVGTNVSDYFPSMGSIPAVDKVGSIWPEAKSEGFEQAFQPSEEQSELTKRLRSYFRRPFDRWENYDDSSDIGIYLDKMNPGNSLWPDLNQQQHEMTLPVAPAEQQDSIGDGKNNYPDLFGGANKPLPLINGFMTWPKGKRRPFEIAVKRPEWMEILDVILGRDRKRWPILTFSDVIKTNETGGSYGQGLKTGIGWGAKTLGTNNSSAAVEGTDYSGGQEKAVIPLSYSLNDEEKRQAYAMINQDGELKEAGILEPAAKVIKEWWLDVDKFGDRVYKNALLQRKSAEQAERAKNKAMKHYRGYKISCFDGQLSR